MSEFALKTSLPEYLRVEQQRIERFAADAGLGFPMIRRRGLELCEKVRSGARDIAEGLMTSGLDQVALSRFAAMVVDRAERCALKL